MAPLAKRAPDLNLPQKICQKRFLEVMESTKRVEKVLPLITWKITKSLIALTIGDESGRGRTP
jgi:hypothetical protein